MATVTVYNVVSYDFHNDEMRLSRRMATKEGAAKMGGAILEDTAMEIDDSQLENGNPWTPRDFGMPSL